MEAVTIIDVLRRAGVEVVAASLVSGPVKGARGTVLIADTTLDEALKSDYDLIALPGGQPGTTNLKSDARILEMLRQADSKGKLLGAVCAAPTVLAEAGLLKGKKATAFPGAFKEIPSDIQLVSETVVEDGRIVTSKSAGTAMDFALALVERLCGKAKRDEVEKNLHRT
jgi:4-methyl-5(b-hydroxyethyl)-thiazole monophosphate biosynthesis